MYIFYIIVTTTGLGAWSTVKMENSQVYECVVKESFHVGGVPVTTRKDTRGYAGVQVT